MMLSAFGIFDQEELDKAFNKCQNQISKLKDHIKNKLTLKLKSINILKQISNQYMKTLMV